MTFLTPYTPVEFAYAKTCAQPRVLVRDEAWLGLKWVILAVFAVFWGVWWLRRRVLGSISAK